MAHVFGERTLATLERLLSLLSAFEVVVWMTDGWPLYESRLKGKLHVISKRYTQRIERHNLNLRQHLARLGRKSLSFSKSVELHDKDNIWQGWDGSRCRSQNRWSCMTRSSGII